jgi:hypothetical protein
VLFSFCFRPESRRNLFLLGYLQNFSVLDQTSVLSQHTALLELLVHEQNIILLIINVLVIIMIPYSDGVFGFSILFRIHGSAIYKALTPAVISSTIYGLLFLYIPSSTWYYPLFVHPYPMAALVTAFTFLLVFRANCKYVLLLFELTVEQKVKEKRARHFFFGCLCYPWFCLHLFAATLISLLTYFLSIFFFKRFRLV